MHPRLLLVAASAAALVGAARIEIKGPDAQIDFIDHTDDSSCALTLRKDATTGALSIESTCDVHTATTASLQQQIADLAARLDALEAVPATPTATPTAAPIAAPTPLLIWNCGPPNQYCLTRDNSGIGGEAAVQAACEADPTCVAYDFRADENVGHLCQATDPGYAGIESYRICALGPAPPPAPPPATATYTCGSPGLYCLERDNENNIEGEELTKALCAADPTCVAYDFRSDENIGHLCTGTTTGDFGPYKMCTKD